MAVGIPLQSRARQWMSDPRPGMQLVAASILLLDPVYGDVARRSMEELARTPQPPVAALARAQLWRTRLGGQASPRRSCRAGGRGWGARLLSEKELQSWRTEIEYLPAWLRAGPQYLLGRGYLSRSLPRDAVTEWLWLGTSYKHLETLSVRALTEAAEALREAASESEADAVTALLRREFPWAAGSVAGAPCRHRLPDLPSGCHRTSPSFGMKKTGSALAFRVSMRENHTSDCRWESPRPAILVPLSPFQCPRLALGPREYRVMSANPQHACDDCQPSVDRRSFLQTVGGTVLTGLAAQAVWAPASSAALCGSPPRAVPRNRRLDGSSRRSTSRRRRPSSSCSIMSSAARSTRTGTSRSRWSATTSSQRSNGRPVTEIVKNVTTPDGYERLVKQTEYDDGGIGGYSIAMFGSPDSDKFQFELTGRHLTLRADGNSVDKAAFGGPIVYGHGEEDPKENLFNYQTKQVNEVFGALDAKQAKAALLRKLPGEAAVPIQGAGKTASWPCHLRALRRPAGRSSRRLSRRCSAPTGPKMSTKVFEILKASGGIDQLHLAFYQQGDLGDDRV